jgi:hypothetical protein
MNYQFLYDKIISNRKNNPYDGYTETHHIIPRCMGGTNDTNNLVDLTAKEHFICHLLLTKIVEKNSPDYYKVGHAFLMMLVKSKLNNNRYITGKKYEFLKVCRSKNMAILQAGDTNTQFGTKWVHNPLLQESKKIKKDELIPDGWYIGRVVNWNIHKSTKICLTCGKIGLKSNKAKYCEKCRMDQRLEWSTFHNTARKKGSC